MTRQTTWVLALLLSAPVFAAPPQPGACTRTANLIDQACRLEAADDLRLAKAVCVNADDPRTCATEAAADFNDQLDECTARRGARADVCAAVGEAPYQPRFGEEFAGDFVNPREIGESVTPNPFMPLIEGARRVHERHFVDDEGQPQIERTVVIVTNRTKLIDGIQCRVVRDTVSVDDKVKEDTEDWFAQDIHGNVWYCGEEVKDYEEFEGDRPEKVELVSIDGSFKAGRDGAKAGIIMQAHPVVGQTYREEASWANAEDLSQVISVAADETAAAAACNGRCLKLRAFSPTEPGINAFKYYAPGIGEIVATEEGERTELVEYSFP